MTVGWTFDSLEKYLSASILAEQERTEQRFEAADKAVVAALAAQKEAANKTEKSAETRHADLVTRLDQATGILTEKITDLALRYEGTVGSSHGMDRAWGYLVGAVGVTVAVVSRVHW